MPFPGCEYKGGKKDHCVKHYIRIHINNGKPVKGKRKFKCDDGTSAPQNRKGQAFAKVISTSAPQNRKGQAFAKVISTSAPQKRKRKKVAKVISEKSPETKKLFVEGKIHFDVKSKEGLNLSFGEFKIKQYIIIENKVDLDGQQGFSG